MKDSCKHSNELLYHNMLGRSLVGVQEGPSSIELVHSVIIGSTALGGA